MSSPSKDDLRRAALSRRHALDAATRRSAGETIASRGLPVDLKPGAVVAGYSPVRDEVDPLPLMQALAIRGAQLALPVIADRSAPLAFRAWSAGAALARGPFGIPEPPADHAAVIPDIVLVPLAAFDRAGHRIGYGAGYYDRTFARLRAIKAVAAIGLAFAVQEVETIPSLPHDARLDFVLTETQAIDFRSV